MKTVVFSILSMLLYAISNIIFEQKLSKMNNLTIIVCYTSVVLVLALIIRQIVRTDDVSFDFPKGNVLWFALGVGVIYTLADYFFIGAYTNGGSLLMITSIVALFPAVASLFKFLLTREIPNMYQISGYILAFVAIILIAKGSVK